jgi:hypothetical protein
MPFSPISLPHTACHFRPFLYRMAYWQAATNWIGQQTCHNMSFFRALWQHSISLLLASDISASVNAIRCIEFLLGLPLFFISTAGRNLIPWAMDLVTDYNFYTLSGISRILMLRLVLTISGPLSCMAYSQAVPRFFGQRTWTTDLANACNQCIALRYMYVCSS